MSQQMAAGVLWTQTAAMQTQAQESDRRQPPSPVLDRQPAQKHESPPCDHLLENRAQTATERGHRKIDGPQSVPLRFGMFKSAGGRLHLGHLVRCERLDPV